MLNNRTASYLLFILSLSFYAIIGYGINRHDTIPLLIGYTLLFSIYMWVLLKEESPVNFWLNASILFRVVLLFSIPTLSDDFYRFIWDGRLLENGIHPFARVPSYYIEHADKFPWADHHLFEKLNSKDSFTIYPAVAQLIFWISAKLSFGSMLASVVIMRMFHVGADIGSLLLMRRLLKHFNLPDKSILLYALNPLVILELTGNLHHEGIMVFFLLLSFYWLTRKKFTLAAIAFALSIHTKLIPLILLPVLFPVLGWKRSLTFYSVTGLAVMILFAPFLTAEFVEGFSESLGYYFKKFEFNASIYYLVREWGYHYYGFNIIAMSGWRLAITSMLLIFLYSFGYIPFILKLKSAITSSESPPLNVGPFTVDRGLWTHFTMVLLIYFLFTTTLHPWYIITIVAFAVFSPLRFTIIWSYLIFLTYAGYTESGYNENLIVIAVEYFLVLVYLFLELSGRKPLKLNGQTTTDHFLQKPSTR